MKTEKIGRRWLNVLAGLVALFSCAATANDMGLIDKAEAAIMRQDFDGAINDLTQAIDSGHLSDQEKMMAYGDRSTAYLQKGDYEQVISDASIAIGLGPKLPYGYVNRGVSYCMLGKNDLGIADFNVALRLGSGEASTYYGRGTCYMHKGDSKRAVKDFSTALHLDPNHSPSLNNRGVSFMHLGQCKLALADFSRAAQLAPGDANARFNMGMARMQLGQYEPALADFDKAIKMAPDMAEAHLWRGAMYATHKQYDNALRDFDDVIRLKPQGSDIYSKAYLARGRVYFDRDKMGQAIADFNAALKLNPSADKTLFYRSLAYFAQGDDQRALADAEALVNMLKGSAPFFVYSERGALRLLGGKFEGANLDFEEAVRRNPEDRHSYLLLYVSLSKTPRSDMAQFTRRLSRVKLDLNKWPDPILAMYQGKISPDRLITLAPKGGAPDDGNDTLCEVPFYAGEYELQRGHEDAGIRLLKQAVETCDKDTIEGGFVAQELDKLKGGK